MQAKPSWDSKTTIVNLVIGVLTLFLPKIGEFVSENPEVSIILVNILNIVLRRFTNTPMTFLGR